MKNFKTKNALKLNKSAIIFLALWCHFLMSTVRAQVAQLVALEEANGVLQAVQTVSSLTKGDYTLAHEMTVFDKTHARRYFGIELTDKYLMNVLQNGKTIYKHTYTRRFPDEKVPFKTESTNSWEYNTVSGRSKPARDGRMKTSHFEVGVALGAAGAADQRDEPTQREPATFHRHAVGPGLVRTQGRP